MPQPIDRLLRPASLALVGASGTEGSFGQRLLATATSWRYGGRIWPVNPRYQTLAGLPCYPSLAALPGVPDLVVLAVSDARVETALSEAATLGVKAAVLFGRAHEEQPGDPPLVERLARIAREAGMAVCGNNCMGFLNAAEGLKVVGTPPPYDGPPDGGIALLSHSGGTWSAFLASRRQLAFRYAVSVGQEIATSMADYIAWLAEDPAVKAVGLVMETVRDPEGFRAALACADRRGLPIAAVKLGRSQVAQRLALAHSGAVSGADAAYDALFARHGVVRCRTLDELADTLELFACGRTPPADGVAVVTDSGGEQQLQADLAAERGLAFASFSEETRARLVQVLDPGMRPDNPLDCYGDGEVLFEPCLRILAEDPGVGLLAQGTNMVGGRPYLRQSTAAVEAIHAATGKPCVIFGNIASTVDPEEAARLRGLGIPVLLGTEEAMAAMAHFQAWHARRRQPGEAPPEDAAVLEAARRWRPRLAAAAGPLPLAEAFALLQDAGIPLVAWRLAENVAAAAAAAAELGFPVALKSARADLLHKSEAGGVALGLTDAAAVATAYDRIAATLGPEVLLQRQAGAGLELLLGARFDPVAGPLVMLGLGGLLVEALGDVQTLAAPFGPAAAGAALEHLKARRLLDGYRGRPGVDRAAFAALASRLSLLVAALGASLAELDLNPVIAAPDGLIAVDALVVPQALGAKP